MFLPVHSYVYFYSCVVRFCCRCDDDVFYDAEFFHSESLQDLIDHVGEFHVMLRDGDYVYDSVDLDSIRSGFCLHTYSFHDHRLSHRIDDIENEFVINGFIYNIPGYRKLITKHLDFLPF